VVPQISSGHGIKEAGLGPPHFVHFASSFRALTDLKDSVETASELRRITKIAHLGAMRVVLLFDDMTVVVANFEPTAAKGGIFARLLNEAYFRKARIAQGGRSLAWPQGLDFCADDLYGPRRRTKSPRVTTYGVQISPEAAVLV